jgi:hypothetical protein
VADGVVHRVFGTLSLAHSWSNGSGMVNQFASCQSGLLCELPLVMARSSLVLGRVSWFSAPIGSLVLRFLLVLGGGAHSMSAATGDQTRSILVFRLSSSGFGNVNLFLHVVPFSPVDFYPLFIFIKSGIGDPRWWSEMDPNWSDIKIILRHHEEISQANSSALQQIW